LCQRGQCISLLGANAQGRAGGGEQGESRRMRQQSGHKWGGIDDVLEVVENEQ